MKYLQVMVILSVFSLTAFSQIKLPSLISDNMVIQRDSEISLWGSGSGKVTVKPSWTDETYTADCDSEGKWLVKVKTPAAGKPCKIDFTDADGSVGVANVLPGEVWLCAGQSNMQFNLSRSYMSNSEVALAKYPDIRLFTVEPAYADEPQTECAGRWYLCDSETVRGFSAVGYFFAKELYAYLGVPIGLIDNSWGGTPAQSWVKRQVLESDDDLKPILARDMETIANKSVYEKEYEQTLKVWQQDVDKAKQLGKTAPVKPLPPMGLRPQNRSCTLYNAMIYPLLNYKIKGVIWYQGESNVDRAYQYRELFASLIESWRQDWNDPDMPFYFVQLASFYIQSPNEHPAVWPAKGEPADDVWAELREAQLMTLKLKNTGMACIIDIGEPYDIHPSNKLDVGRRLSLWALSGTYGIKDIVVSGPLYKSFAVEGDKIRVSFDHTAGGLMAKGAAVEGFQIAGEDKKFVWADAVIEGDTVVVSSEAVKMPVALRYAWAIWPYCNLFNDKGLPASPFRTDDWKGITDDLR